jgi:hypothetical protein
MLHRKNHDGWVVQFQKVVIPGASREMSFAFREKFLMDSSNRSPHKVYIAGVKNEVHCVVVRGNYMYDTDNSHPVALEIGSQEAIRVVRPSPSVEALVGPIYEVTFGR